MRPARDFYVYHLVDPRDDSCFYVGKGSGLRAWSHALDVRKGRSFSNAEKTNRIVEIHAAGFEVHVEIVFRTESEREALAHEGLLIETLPGLTNVNAGWLSLPSDAELERRSRRGVIADAERRIAIAKADLRRWLAGIPLGSTFTIPGLPNGDALAAEYVAMARKMVGEPAC